ncbi:hypothetical protein [Neisseria sicca]|nr:hypothetical protein [Neisseria sicca]
MKEVGGWYLRGGFEFKVVVYMCGRDGGWRGNIGRVIDGIGGGGWIRDVE